jgi:hypothetical protein
MGEVTNTEQRGGRNEVLQRRRTPERKNEALRWNGRKIDKLDVETEIPKKKSKVGAARAKLRLGKCWTENSAWAREGN